MHVRAPENVEWKWIMVSREHDHPGTVNLIEAHIPDGALRLALHCRSCAQIWTGVRTVGDEGRFVLHDLRKPAVHFGLQRPEIVGHLR